MMYRLQIYFKESKKPIEARINSQEELDDIYDCLKDRKFLELHESQFGNTGLFGGQDLGCDMILINVSDITLIKLIDLTSK